ncbi:type II secretion system F family protein [Fluctibacter halophilus]|uniref:type II secretion system F family protein n=1 Tax=Fluctibacter halophilus TaxID=226011 RepID=UPI001E407EF6|nr:type II secretion system F family protein [Aestuariibacter halophilus]
MVIAIKESASLRNRSRNQGKDGRVGLKNLEFITAELAILLNSGVKIDKGLSILSRGVSDAATGNLLQKLSTEIKNGSTVANAFAAQEGVFSPLFINMLRLGESSGTLSEVFAKLAEELTFQRQLRSKIVQSLTYPSVILAVCVACILFVFNYIVPQMSGMFDRADDLPLYTELLLGLSDWFVSYQWYLLAAIVVGGYALYRGWQQPTTRRRLDEIGLKLPLIGTGIRLVERIRFNSSMAMGLSSGVALVDAIALAKGNIANQQIAQTLQASRNRIKQGERLSVVLKSVPIYSDFQLSLVEVGEESGDLEPVFAEIAHRAREEFEGWTKTLTNMIEPLLILLMGGIVGSVVVVMLLSIVSTNDVGL